MARAEKRAYMEDLARQAEKGKQGKIYKIKNKSVVNFIAQDLVMSL